MNLKELIENATPAQKEKVFQCKSAEQLQQFAKIEGLNLSDEDATELFTSIHINTCEISDDDLDNVAGGKYSGGCPLCGSTNYEITGSTRIEINFICKDCGETWGVGLG